MENTTDQFLEKLKNIANKHTWSFFGNAIRADENINLCPLIAVYENWENVPINLRSEVIWAADGINIVGVGKLRDKMIEILMPTHQSSVIL